MEKSDKIHEKELLQTSADKETKMNERSFIFINQLFKTPLRNQLYNSQTHNLNKPFTISERLPQVNVIHSTSAKENVSPLKLFIPTIKIITGDVNLQNAPSYKNQRDKYREQKNGNKDQKYTLQSVRQEDLEKPANYKPLNIRDNERLDKDSNSQESINTYQSNDPYQEMTSYARHRINYKYGFPMFQKPTYGNNYLFSMPGDQGSLVIDNISPLDVPDEGDKLLERYIKDTLDEIDTNDLADHNDAEKCPNCKTNENNQAKTSKCDSNEIKTAKNSDTDIKHTQKHDKNNRNDKSSVNSAASTEIDNLFAYQDIWSS